MTQSKEEYYHNKGEQDRSDKAHDHKVGHFQPPHGIIDELTTWDKDKREEQIKENEAYKEGWRNTDDQIEKNK